MKYLVLTLLLSLSNVFAAYCSYDHIHKYVKEEYKNFNVWEKHIEGYKIKYLIADTETIKTTLGEHLMIKEFYFRKTNRHFYSCGRVGYEEKLIKLRDLEKHINKYDYNIAQRRKR